MASQHLFVVSHHGRGLFQFDAVVFACEPNLEVITAKVREVIPGLKEVSDKPLKFELYIPGSEGAPWLWARIDDSTWGHLDALASPISRLRVSIMGREEEEAVILARFAGMVPGSPDAASPIMAPASPRIGSLRGGARPPSPHDSI